MSRLAGKPLAYRHVVFPTSSLRGGPFNFSPARIPAPPLQPDAIPLPQDQRQSIQWLFQKAGLNLADYRQETIRRRVAACLRALRVESLDQACRALQRDPHLVPLALSALIIGITSFFRDPAVFTALADSVLPQVLRQSPAPRIWSIGCSDGAELYSIAILLDELEGLRRSYLLGTDCRTDALAVARSGSYELAALKNLPSHLLGQYFQFQGCRFRICPDIRGRVQWRTGNVLAGPEPGEWDLIFCRNLAIYLQPHITLGLWARLEQFIRPGGFLVLGKAERPLGTAAMTPVAPCIWRRELTTT